MTALIRSIKRRGRPSVTWIAAPFVAYRVGLPAARRPALSELDGEPVAARVRLDFHNPAFERPAAAVEAA